MARVKLSEFDAKRLLFPSQSIFRATTRTTSGQIKKTFGTTPLVVKLDQGIKKRGLQGLVAVGVTPQEAVSFIRKWSDQGYSQFLIEPLLKHAKDQEKYLSLSLARSGWLALSSDQGGIDIEENWESVKSVDPANFKGLTDQLEKYHLATLEINPYLLQDGVIVALDAAAEIDDAALNLAALAPLSLAPVTAHAPAASEQAVETLDAATPASLKFKLLNPAGRIWMLLSGGGASIVLADEVADLGLGNELANYGEYSGAPTDDDTYSYAKIILKQMLANQTSKSQALVIAGGVANFTDVAKTFKGLIRALDEVKAKLVSSHVKVYVRRGGPNEKKGLSLMENFLNESHLLGVVYGHETPLTQVVSDVVEYLS